MPTESKTNYITTIFGADIQDLRAGVRSVKQELKDIDREFNKTTSTMGDWKKSADGLTAKIDSLQKKINAHKKIIAGYDAEINKLSEDKKKNATQIEQLKVALDKEYVALNKNYKSMNYYQNQLDKLNTKTSTMSTKTEDATKSVEKLNKGFTILRGTMANLISSAILTIIRKIGDMIKEVVNLGIEFDSSFTDVQKTVEATNAQFMQLESTIRRMALEMPQTASAIAEVASIAGQLGIEVEDIEEFTRVMVMLGDTTNMVAEEASDMFARFTNITSTSGDEYEKLASVIVDLGNNFATTESELLDMGQRLAGTATVAGLTETEILALASAMSSVGIQAELGGTAMSRIISKMQTEVETLGEHLNRFAEITGHTREEFISLFKSDPYKAIQDFIKGLSDMAEEGDSAIVALNDLGINETRMRDTILRLTSAYDLLDESMTRANKAWEDGTALSVEANLRYDTTASKIQLMKNTWSEVALEIYDAVEPAFRGLIDVATDLGKAFIPQETNALSLEAKLKNLQIAVNNYKTAQDEAKKSTDALTQAMLLQTMQAQVNAVYEFAEAYQSALDAQEKNQSKIEKREKALKNLRLEMEAYASELGYTVDELKEIYSSGEWEERMHIHGYGYDITIFEEYLQAEQRELEKIAELNEGLEALQNSYNETLVTATKMATEGALDLETLKKANNDLYEDVIKLAEAYERGVDTMEGFNVPTDQLNDHIKVLEKQISTIDNTTEAYWRMVGVLSVLYGLQQATGGGGGKPVEEEIVLPEYITKARQFIQEDMPRQKQAMKDTGSSEYEIDKTTLEAYEDALYDYIAGGGRKTDPLARHMMAVIENLKDKLGAVNPEDSWLAGIINAGGFTAEISEMLDSTTSKLEEFENTIKTIYTGIFNVMNSVYQTQINNIDALIDEQEKKLEQSLGLIEQQTNEVMAVLNTRYASGEISEEEYYKGVQKAQADSLNAQQNAEQEAEQKRQQLLAERDALAKKQFEANKANEIANVWINLGSAIMKTYAESGWILGSIFSALLLAQAGAQTALIASQKYVPQMAKGGVVDSPTFAMIGEDGKEVVMPLENNMTWLKELATQLTQMMGDGMTVGVKDRKYDYSRQMNFTQVINSPKALTRKEIYSQTRELVKIANRR